MFTEFENRFYLNVKAKNRLRFPKSSKTVSVVIKGRLFYLDKIEEFSIGSKTKGSLPVIYLPFETFNLAN